MPTNLLLTGGVLHTSEPAMPQAQALVIAGERIAYVGDAPSASAYAKSHGPYETIDLSGACVLPGLTDAHIHLGWYALGLTRVQAHTDTLEACLERVAEHVACTPEGAWITGLGWDHNLWGGEFPTRHYLDRVAPHHPVALHAKSGHATWTNSLALQRAGITRETADPPGGQIVRDAAGIPTGILLETAAGLVQQAIPEPDVEKVAEAIRHALPEIHRLGLTGVHDFSDATTFRALQRLHAEGALTLRVLKSVPLENVDAAIAMGVTSGYGDARLRLGHVKIFADGALGPRTAWMLEGYDDAPEDTGIATLTVKELRDSVQRAASHGLACAIHAIGDRAVREVLSALAALPPGLRRLRLPHRVEHAQLIHPDDLPRFAELGVVASMQPIHATADMEIAERHWGARCAGAYAWASLLRTGARLAFGSDCPVEPLDPLAGIHAAVTRRRADGYPGPEGWQPQERLSVAQAVAGFTSGAAYAAGLADQLGTLAPGKLADLTILDRNPAAVPPDELLAIQVLGTYVGGELVWEGERK